MLRVQAKISVISKFGFRCLEGRLFTVDPQECTIALANVRSFGTEDRDTQFPVVPQNQVYEYILFRGSDIKDIRVVNNVHSIPNDPAIVQMTVQQAPIGQPTYQMIPTSNYPHPMMAGMAGPASSIPGFPGAYPMSMGGGGGHNMMANNARPQNQHIMNNNQINKAPSELNPASGETNMNNITNIMPMTNVKPQMTKPVEQTMEDGVLDLISGSGGGGGGGSRSNTPTPSLIARKSPSIDQATQAGHQQRVGKIGEKTANRNAHQNQHQQHRDGHRGRSGSALSQYSDTKRDSGNHHHHDNNQMDNHAHRGMHNAAPGGNHHQQQQQQHQRGGGNNNNNNNNRGGWIPRSGNNMQQQRGRGRGSGGRGGVFRTNQQGNNATKPKNTLKFENDYDFEQANTEFEELRLRLAKTKIDAGTENEKKDDSGNETGAGEGEPEEDSDVIHYDKSKSFFDNISCEAVERSKGSQRTDWRTERKLNSETFGVSSTRRGGFRGRGGYYNRGGMYRGNNQGGNYHHQGQMNNNGGGGGYRGGNYHHHRGNNRAAVAPANNNNNINRNTKPGGASMHQANNSGQNRNATNNDTQQNRRLIPGNV
ncbi:protein LSM14 homolog B-like isoform X2 [Aphidius gifuensis]|uniref:protein LSM14 homolog B-like isoform X2 n=1 Tax=Aphidius gifuensis TaxID=684658 RepID=UPI001CDB799A|nr:protein LSM14 homolog B-like isoform X2 [Aphidius gifuensis]